MNKKFKKRNTVNTHSVPVTQRKIVEERNNKGMLGLFDEETGKQVFPYGDYTFSTHSIHKKSLMFLVKTDRALWDEYIGIYNKLKDKVLANHWKVVGQLLYPGYRLLYLENPETGNLHLFNEKTYGTKFDIFNNGYKKIKFLGDFFGTYPFALTNNSGKCALYINDEGFITGFEYDNIECEARILILTKKDKKTFIYGYDDSRKQSSEYDDIKCDGEYIYCKNGKVWEVYIEKYGSIKFAFTEVCDNIKQLGKMAKKDGVRRTLNHVFLQEKDGKYGLLEGAEGKIHPEETTKKTLVNMECDNISLFPGTENILGLTICSLVKDNKLGLFGYDVHNPHQTQIKYDRIDMIYGHKVFALYTGDKCDI